MKWWTVLRMENAEDGGGSIVVVRKGKMTVSGMKSLARKYALKHKLVKKGTNIAFRHVFQEKKPQF